MSSVTTRTPMLRARADAAGMRNVTTGAGARAFSGVLLSLRTTLLSGKKNNVFLEAIESEKVSSFVAEASSRRSLKKKLASSTPPKGVKNTRVHSPIPTCENDARQGWGGREESGEHLPRTPAGG